MVSPAPAPEHRRKITACRWRIPGVSGWTIRRRWPGRLSFSHSRPNLADDASEVHLCFLLIRSAIPYRQSRPPPNRRAVHLQPLPGHPRGTPGAANTVSLGAGATVLRYNVAGLIFPSPQIGLGSAVEPFQARIFARGDDRADQRAKIRGTGSARNQATALPIGSTPSRPDAGAESREPRGVLQRGGQRRRRSPSQR